MREAHEHIAASVDRILADDARRNEMRITYVRVVCYFATALVDVLIHLHPPAPLTEFPLSNAAIAGSLGIGSLILLQVLRRSIYTRWMPLALPVFDGVGVLLIAHVYWSSGLPIEFDYSGVVAVLLAASAGLRFRRDSIVVTCLVGLYVFVHVQVLIGRDPLRIPFVCVVILGAGMFAFWCNELVRRTVASEIARRTLARFLPPQVVEDAHADPEALFGEPRSIAATILISDLRGFTGLAEKLSPADAMSFLSELQGRFAEVVWQHGGTVDKFMGDGMLAVFGAAGDDEDHAARALAAARAMLDELDAINRRRAGPPARLGIGVHTGEVVAGVIGSQGHFEFTVIGDTVNTASRLEAMTKDQETPLLVSAATLDAATGAASELEPCGSLPVRGRSEPLRVFRLPR